MLWKNRTIVILLSAALLLSVGFLLYPATFLGSLSANTVFDSEAQSLEHDPLGIILIDIASEEAANSFHVTQMGVYVLAVQENSPADLAGLRSGDQILSFASQPVTSSQDIGQVQIKPGKLASLVIVREGQQNTLQVRLAAD